MKRFTLVALFALMAFVGGSVATLHNGGNAFYAGPAPAATLPAPTATPTNMPSPVGNTGPDLGLPDGYPTTWYSAFNLNTINTAIDIVNLAGSSGQTCNVSVFGTFVATLAVTQASTFAHLQSATYVTGYITAPGIYTFTVSPAQPYFQVENILYASGNPLVSANCGGGTVLYPGGLLK